MADLITRVRIGTRGSVLARWQTDYTASLLRNAYPDLRIEISVISTRGDRILDEPLPLIGGKGLFTSELESALHNREIDLAVHSLKDLPTEDPDGLSIGAVPIRARVNDVLISRDGVRFDELPEGATLGTSSRRRAAQILNKRPDLQIIDIRGNVPTRIQKVKDPNGSYDGTILACAGLERLGLLAEASEILPLDLMLPAPGQGALGVQCRDENESISLLAPLNHRETRLAVEAERAFLSGLGGGCSMPIAAYASICDETLYLRGRISSVDGREVIEMQNQQALAAGSGKYETARQAGAALVQTALLMGAGAILEAST